MEILQVWAAHGDGGERSIGPIIGYFDTEDRAHEFAKQKGWYGGNGNVSRKHALRIDGLTYILDSKYPVDMNREQETRDAALKEATLAELSPEQRRVLGFK